MNHVVNNYFITEEKAQIIERAIAKLAWKIYFVDIVSEDEIQKEINKVISLLKDKPCLS